MRKLQTEFFLKTHEVTEQYADEMLGALPPEMHATNGFLVGEPTDHAEDMSGHFGARYQFIFEHDGRYYDGGLASVSDFEAFLIPLIMN